MISGFVISMSAINAKWYDFLIARAVRLYPAFWICCTITSIVIFAIGSPQYTVNIKQYVVNLSLLSNYLDVPSIDGVYWSLFIEIKFYALVMLLILIKKIQSIEQYLWIWTLLTLALELFPYNLLRILFITNYAAYFISGACFFVILRNGINLQRLALVVITWILALHETITVQLPKFRASFHKDLNPYIVAITITAFFVIMWFISTRHRHHASRSSWLIVGMITYPLYLLHQNIGYIIFNHLTPMVSPHLLLWGTIIFMLMLAYSIQAWIEKPLAYQLKKALQIIKNKVLGNE